MAASADAPQLPLALTMGDPSGIGPEIAVHAWRDRARDELPPFAVYADIDLMRAQCAAFGEVEAVPIATAEMATAIFPRALPVVDVPLVRAAHAGAPDAQNGPAVILAIKRAVADIAAGRVMAIVTNPIAKAVLYDAGFSFAGHTEYLGALAKEFWPPEPADPVMMLASSALRVVPVTIHVPLQSVPSLLTTERIVATTRIVAAALRRDFAIADPRLVVTGLNPHAGENGALGHEDRDIIVPAIAALKSEGLNVAGPYSADTLFHAAARATYDAAIAMYHDQALIPIKTLSFDEGVNVTLGLPFVRTSPDHGTAFGIAGKGIASAASLKAALKLAAEMSARRVRAAQR
ncbi:4-hydroxythreonine-4-phosphate dehydrogenase PdxA [Hyphomicrobium sp.]|jgi:4-hydroxythreonine-4-phosphate dehydrogenase|uniref:4-hydroxythreonine-4-phosphate dehydrogenase PdxA n=1 Tax=Hyphomicrobium sp. TaxID=82 RepID=UPI002C62118C|nr:4-hydroxythreonine-4-phosphate dehydrogenase PdxA [Hyphomicrobium sp.]HVZ05281.1 4-hydroxythreonine-4-phosphate dehydrogenase PdxA [Hyphomicrobium sp.]